MHRQELQILLVTIELVNCFHFRPADLLQQWPWVVNTLLSILVVRSKLVG
jgi:hypothetical protein